MIYVVLFFLTNYLYTFKDTDHMTEDDLEIGWASKCLHNFGRAGETSPLSCKVLVISKENPQGLISPTCPHNTLDSNQMLF